MSDRPIAQAAMAGFLAMANFPDPPESPASELVRSLEEAMKPDPWKRQIVTLTPPSLDLYWNTLSPATAERLQRPMLKAARLPRRGRPPCARCNGPLLRRYRGEYSQFDFAGKCGVSEDTIQRGERGKPLAEEKFIQMAKTISLLTGLEISPQDLKA
jgi:hypothetical protein